MTCALIDWRQEDALCIANLPAETHLGSLRSQSAAFVWWGLLPAETLRNACQAFARARVFLATGPALLLRGFVAGGGAPLGSGSSSWSSCRKPGSWGACPLGPVRPARPRPFLLPYTEWFAFPPHLDAQVQRGLPSPASPDSESRQHPPGHRLRGLWLRAGSAGCAFRP